MNHESVILCRYLDYFCNFHVMFIFYYYIEKIARLGIIGFFLWLTYRFYFVISTESTIILSKTNVVNKICAFQNRNQV